MKEPKTRKRKGVIALSIIGILALIIIVSLISSSGLVNLLLRNALAFDRNIPDPGWSGQSYEHVHYADESISEYVDIYVPDHSEVMPLIVMVHGGGFIYGDSQSRQSMLLFQEFRSKGYACASINYRLAQEAAYPAAMDDVFAAIRFLRKNADTYGYDPDRFVIWGESAGGYLASMAAFSDDNEYTGVSFIGQEKNETVSAKVDGLLDFYGVLDLDRCDSDFDALKTPRWLRSLVGVADVATSQDSIATQFFGKPMVELTKEETEERSPTFKAANSKNELKVYITHGTVDITVPRLQSERLYETCVTRYGAENVTYLPMKNLKHADDRFYTSKNLAPVVDFVDHLWD